MVFGCARFACVAKDAQIGIALEEFSGSFRGRQFSVGRLADDGA